MPWGVAVTAQRLIAAVLIISKVTLVCTDFRVMKYGMYANGIEAFVYIIRRPPGESPIDFEDRT